MTDSPVTLDDAWKAEADRRAEVAAADLALGAAWRHAEAALPEGVEMYVGNDLFDPPERRWHVEVSARILTEGPTAADWSFTADFQAHILFGPTPTAALIALTDALSKVTP